MTKILPLLILFHLFSCSGKTENREFDNLPSQKQAVSIQKKNTDNLTEISLGEKKINKFIDSIKIFKIHPIDTLELDYNIVQLENHQIGRNRIQIFKRDSLNIDWIKINSDKLHIKNLKTINPRVDSERQEMFCNSLKKIKLYKFNNDEIIFLELASYPCTGLGCSVSDYLIYDLKNKQVNLFGNFRTADLDFYNFPFDKKLNYISTESQGDLHEAAQVHYISRIYSMDNKGRFQLTKDSRGKEYYFEIITFPDDVTEKFKLKRNWF